MVWEVIIQHFRVPIFSCCAAGSLLTGLDVVWWYNWKKLLKKTRKNFPLIFFRMWRAQLKGALCHNHKVAHSSLTCPNKLGTLNVNISALLCVIQSSVPHGSLAALSLLLLWLPLFMTVRVMSLFFCMNYIICKASDAFICCHCLIFGFYLPLQLMVILKWKRRRGFWIKVLKQHCGCGYWNRLFLELLQISIKIQIPVTFCK